MTRLKYALFALVALPIAAQAQFDFAGPLSPGIAPSTFGYDAISLHVQQEAAANRRRAASGNKAKARSSMETAVAAEYLDMTYRPSLSRRAANLASFVAKSRRLSGEGAAELEKLLQGADVIGEVGRSMRDQYGMSVNDVGDAFAVWWATAWMGYQGSTDSPTAEQMATVRRQIADAFASDSKFQSASDAQKQQFAEALIIDAAINELIVGAAQKNPPLMKQVKAVIATKAKAQGISLDSMVLTDEGFVSVNGVVP